MADYYIKALNELAFWGALQTAGLAHKAYDPFDPDNIRPEELAPEAEWSPQGKWQWQAIDGVDLDVIGTMYTETGETLTSEEGVAYPETAAVDGFHANLRAVLTPEQQEALPLIDPPTTPQRRWAGDDVEFVGETE